MIYKNEHKILVILDLDETLIHSSEKELDRKADFKFEQFFIYKRPHLKSFLEKIKNDFLVAVWSSASDDYVKHIVKHIFPKNYSLEFVWGRSRCTQKNKLVCENYFKSFEDYSNPFYFVKTLAKLKRHKYKINKVLIVDDSPEKAENNFGNAIYPKEYLGELEDDELLKLAKYLEQLKNSNNVRNIEKRGWRTSIK